MSNSGPEQNKNQPKDDLSAVQVIYMGIAIMIFVLGFGIFFMLQSP